jgi:hypothetical protein
MKFGHDPRGEVVNRGGERTAGKFAKKVGGVKEITGWHNGIAEGGRKTIEGL